MKLIPVEKIPERRRPHKKLQKLIEEFAASDAKIVRIDYDSNDYKNEKSCVSSFYNAVKCSGHQTIRVVLRGTEIYLIKE